MKTVIIKKNKPLESMTVENIKNIAVGNLKNIVIRIE